MDIELLDNQAILSGLRFPFKVSKVTQVVIARGEASCIVDFYSYTLKAPSVAIFLPGQIIESIEASDDFEGFGMMTTVEFTDSLNLPVGFSGETVLQVQPFLFHQPGSPAGIHDLLYDGKQCCQEGGSPI